jgi:hypothetical protein
VTSSHSPQISRNQKTFNTTGLTVKSRRDMNYYLIVRLLDAYLQAYANNLAMK